jgi:hypothetical protein
MTFSMKNPIRVAALLAVLFLTFRAQHLTAETEAGAAAPASPARLEKRWLFFWRDMNNPQEIDAMIARFPAARGAGYNGVVFSHNIAPSKATALKAAAQENHLALIPAVMGGARDRNYVEGVPVKDALFIAHDGRANLEQDNPTRLKNAAFEDAAGNHFKGWGYQDDEGITTFADHEITHGGKTSLRMQDIGKNQYQHCRISQPIALRPFRHYRVSFWVKTENLAPADAEVKVLSTNGNGISFQTFHVEATQDWKRYDIVFNSFDNDKGTFYLGTWNGKSGKLWWDDVEIAEIGLVNVLRRPGCPVTVRGEDGIEYEEGRDFQKISDPLLNPWWAYHEEPAIKLAPGSRIRDGARLRVSYYHPITVYEDRITECLSEPKIFADWEEDVRRVNELLHPEGFLMSHDELRCVNQCGSCRSKGMTAGELLAWNVRQSTAIIRKIRRDAEIWVWNDMFDPMHNAIDHYYAVNGTLAGSWKGLDKDVGIVNWHGGLKGKNCQFFADLGLRQILSGYYDGDDSGEAISEWLQNTKSVPGIVGAMYTTWENKYGAMQTWAAKAWGKP